MRRVRVEGPLLSSRHYLTQSVNSLLSSAQELATECIVIILISRNLPHLTNRNLFRSYSFKEKGKQRSTCRRIAGLASIVPSAMVQHSLSTEKMPALWHYSQTTRRAGHTDSQDLEVYAERPRPDSAGSRATPLLAADFALLGKPSRRALGRRAVVWRGVCHAKAQRILPKRQGTGQGRRSRTGDGEGQKSCPGSEPGQARHLEVVRGARQQHPPCGILPTVKPRHFCPRGGLSCSLQDLDDAAVFRHHDGGMILGCLWVKWGQVADGQPKASF